MLSSLEHPTSSWSTAPEIARASLSAAVSLVLRLLGRDPDPAKSRDHVLLSVLAERRLREGVPADLGSLLADVAEPPVETIGSLPVQSFMSAKERADLAASLNALLASPTFATWREGATLNIREWLTPKDGKTQAVVVSVAHLDDDERNLVLGILLEEVLTWVRSLPGSKHLKALLFFDEVYGYLPPHPQRPPTKQPLMSLFSTESVDSLRSLIKSLSDRWFLLRNLRSELGTVLYQPRWALSYLRGPLTLAEIARLRG